MQNKLHVYATVFLMLTASLILLGLSKTSTLQYTFGFLSGVFSPLQQTIFTVASSRFWIFSDWEKERLRQDYNDAVKNLVDQNVLQKENNALRDQFNTALPTKLRLLPSTVIGAPSFVPGVSVAEYFILDKGQQAGVRAGQAVVYKNNVVGQIVSVSSHVAKVQLIVHFSSSFTVKTMETQALGVVKGEGESLYLENVLLSEKLKEQDIVVTKGDIDIDGNGYPPDLVVGKIQSIEKRPSALFQVAKVESLLDFTKLTMVFIIVGYTR